MWSTRGPVLEDDVERFVGTMMPLLNEKQRRIFLGSLSVMLGTGGATELSELTGVTPQTITAGRRDAEKAVKDPGAKPLSSSGTRIRTAGGGRKSVAEKNPGLVEALMRHIDGSELGDPMGPLRWTVKSTRALEALMKADGYNVSNTTIGTILKHEGFSLQQNKKYTESGDPGPDRDGQFRFISTDAAYHIYHGDPVISVDTKKKEIVGNFKNNGSEWRPKGEPRVVNDHDFMGPEGKAVPYGIYDIDANEGFVSVGMSADTAEFAVNSIRTWWERMGSERYPDASSLMITADCGGSNNRRSRLWKKKLQELADDTGLRIDVRHYPPGTSKWNKIEHRMFSYISMHWAATPLTSYQLIIDLIGGTTTKLGLKIEASLDTRTYEKGIKVTDEELEGLNITEDEWRGDWNYSICPHAK